MAARESQATTSAFGTFLEAAIQPGPTREGSNAQLKLLTILRELTGPESVSELQRRSGLDPAEFGDAIRDLREAKLITLKGPSGDEIIALTKAGSTVASFAS